MTLANLNQGASQPLVPGEADWHIVRFAPDHGADWPLWTLGGLLSGEELALSADLCDQLQAWAEEFEAHLTLEGEWKPGFDHQRFDRTGDALAAAVAEELGRDYSVLRATGDALPWWRSDEPATNPRAAAVLDRYIATEEN